MKLNVKFLIVFSLVLLSVFQNLEARKLRKEIDVQTKMLWTLDKLKVI